MTEQATTAQATTTTEGGATSTSADAATSTQSGAGDASTQQQATTAQAAVAQDKPADGAATEADKGSGQKPGAPEKYEFKTSEGQTFNNDVLSAFSDAAKAADLSQEAAQGILSKLEPALQARNAQVLEEAKQTWASELKADKEIGGDKLTANLAIAKKALSEFGDAELSELLEHTGLGNNRAIARLLVKVGNAISEDKTVPGSIGAPTLKDAANALYGPKQ